MRNISFSATKEQFRARDKCLTSRLGWEYLLDHPHEHLMGVEKCQGLKKGEKIVRMGEIVVLDAWREPQDEILRRPERKPRTPEEWQVMAARCHYWGGKCGCGHPENLGLWCGVRIARTGKNGLLVRH